MTILEAVKTLTSDLIYIVPLILIVLQLFLVIISFTRQRSLKIRALYIVHLMITFFLVYLPLMNFKWVLCLRKSDSLPDFLMEYGKLPADAFIVYEVITAVVLCLAYMESNRFRKNHLTPDCIKETMDLLPAGLVFAKPDGTVIFRNIAMNELSRRLTGKGIYDVREFLGSIACENIGSENNGNKNSRIQVVLPDNSQVWQIESGNIAKADIQNAGADECEDAGRLSEENYIQMTAANITEEAEILRELEEKNRKLQEIHARLKIYNKQSDRIIAAQELLTARIAVHNELGNVLLESRHYLNEPGSIDETLLLQALKNTNTYLLREYEENDTQRDMLGEALETARTIGVEISITGIPPKQTALRNVLAGAINECSTNTVKHAGGDLLNVDIRKSGDMIIYTFGNNGTAPAGEIRESGGLLSLRCLVENEGGSMKITGVPEFKLEISLPTGK